MVQSAIEIYTIQVVPADTACDFEPKLLDHVNGGDKVIFANETESQVRITFSNEEIFDAQSIILAPRPDKRTLFVQEGEPTSVQCTVDCNYQSGGAVTLGAKPVVIINRD
jgi:hypothetical protein